jgi:hypothetical protein
MSSVILAENPGKTNINHIQLSELKNKLTAFF